MRPSFPFPLALAVAVLLNLLCHSSASDVPHSTARFVNVCIRQPYSRTCLTSCPISPQSSDTGNVDKIESTGSSIEYFPPLNPFETAVEKVKSTGMIAKLTRDLLASATEIGSYAYCKDFPPGFGDIRADGGVAHRGHFLARTLGGSGSDIRNIAALYANANRKMYWQVERNVSLAFSTWPLGDKDRVLYSVRANYKAGRDSPDSLDLEVKLEKAFTLLKKTSYLSLDWYKVNIKNSKLAEMEKIYDNTALLEDAWKK